MNQLTIIDDIAGAFSGSNGINVLSDIFNLIKDFINSFFSTIISSIQFIITMFTFFPSLLVDSIFNELPYTFKIGLTSLFSIFIALFILKLLQLIKFW